MAMENQIHTDAAVSRYLRWVRLDAALLIAAVAGALTLNGYAYLEKYYITLGVPIDRLGFSAQKLAAYGAASFVSFISAIFVVAALVGVLTLGMVLCEQPRRVTPATWPKWRWVRYINQRLEAESVACRVVLLLVGGAVFALLAWYLLLMMPSDTGYRRALSEAGQCVPQHVVYRTEAYIACVVAETADTLYLVISDSADEDHVAFRTLLLPREGLVKIESGVRVR